MKTLYIIRHAEAEAVAEDRPEEDRIGEGGELVAAMHQIGDATDVEITDYH